MKIDSELIHRVAAAARLKVTPQEEQSLIREMTEVLEVFDKIDKIDTDSIRPSFHPIAIRNNMREDKIEPSLDAEDALKNTEHKKENYFMGPGAV